MADSFIWQKIQYNSSCLRQCHKTFKIKKKLRTTYPIKKWKFYMYVSCLSVASWSFHPFCYFRTCIGVWMIRRFSLLDTIYGITFLCSVVTCWYIAVGYCHSIQLMIAMVFKCIYIYRVGIIEEWNSNITHQIIGDNQTATFERLRQSCITFPPAS